MGSIHHHFPNLDNIPFNIMKEECKWLMSALNNRATVIGTSIEDFWFLEWTEDKPNNLQNNTDSEYQAWCFRNILKLAEGKLKATCSI